MPMQAGLAVQDALAEAWQVEWSVAALDVSLGRAALENVKRFLIRHKSTMLDPLVRSINAG